MSWWICSTSTIVMNDIFMFLSFHICFCLFLMNLWNTCESAFNVTKDKVNIKYCSSNIIIIEHYKTYLLFIYNLFTSYQPIYPSFFFSSLKALPFSVSFCTWNNAIRLVGNRYYPYFVNKRWCIRDELKYPHIRNLLHAEYLQIQISHLLFSRVNLLKYIFYIYFECSIIVYSFSLPFINSSILLFSLFIQQIYADASRYTQTITDTEIEEQWSRNQKTWDQ